MRSFKIRIDFHDLTKVGLVLAQFTDEEIIKILAMKMELFLEDWTDDPIELAMKNAVACRPKIEGVKKK